MAQFVFKNIVVGCECDAKSKKKNNIKHVTDVFPKEETVKYRKNSLCKLPEIRYKGTRSCALINTHEKKFFLLHLFSRCKANLIFFKWY